MEIWQLKYFIQVCDDNSFSKASKSLHISQQGLSKTIKNLENELGRQLFYRSSKGAIPTEFGDLLLEKSQKVVKDFDSMVDYVYERAHINKGLLSIGLPHMLYTNVFASIICKFIEVYPDIQLKVVNLGSFESEKYIQNNMLDIAFASEPDNIDRYMYIPVSSINMKLLVNANSPLAQNGSVKFETLKKQKFILPPPEYRLRQLVIDTCNQYGFIPDIIFTTSQHDLIIEMVGLNEGVAILPENITVNAAKYNDNVRVILFSDVPVKLEMGFMMNKDKKIDFLIKSFIGFTRKFFKEYNQS